MDLTALVLGIFVFFYTFLAHPIEMKGASMTPNYNNGEYYTVSAFDKDYKRGDVIVFTAPVDRTQQYVKRLVGLPGDKIEIRQGKFYLNDQEQKESYLPEGTYDDPGAFLQEAISYTLKEDEYFVMGDNRVHSSDSRSWGPIKKEDVSGKIWFKYKDAPKETLAPLTN